MNFLKIKRPARAAIKVADEVWIATASLHRKHPEQVDFSVEEIRQSVAAEGLVTPPRPGVYVHIQQHCVANRPPNPGPYRMLLETGRGRRRLFRPGDPYHPRRARGKIAPRAEEIPACYADLLAWYRDWSAAGAAAALRQDPLLTLSGLGSSLWADQDPDEYVRQLREGWS